MSFQNVIYPLISGIQVPWQYLPAEIVAKLIPKMHLYCHSESSAFGVLPSNIGKWCFFSYIYHSDLF